MGILEPSNNSLELGLWTEGAGDAMGGDIWPVIGTWGSNSIGMDMHLSGVNSIWSPYDGF
jgi:hypothetical protein